MRTPIGSRRRTALLLAALACLAGSPRLTAAAAAPIMRFAAEGSLALEGTGGADASAQGKAEDFEFVPGRRGQAIRPKPDQTLTLPLTGLNPQEGTLMFWFRPDWSPGTWTPVTWFEIKGGPGFHVLFRRGWTAPEQCYVQAGATDAVACSFGTYRIFTADTWRHYALRWSASRGQIQFVVDGEAAGPSGARRTGVYTMDAKEPLAATLTFFGAANGALDEITLFDRYLTVADLVQAAPLPAVARDLQAQSAPVGSGAAGPAARVSYVDPASGQTVAVPMPGGDGETTPAAAYNPARMPQLRVTPHTPWAKPLAGGTVRALFVMPTGFYNEKSPLREAVELWQRLDLDCDVTDRADSAVLQKEYDVIAITYQGWSGGGKARHFGESGWIDIDETLRAWILERVNAGRSGLVYAYPIAKRTDAAIAEVFAPERRVPSTEILRGFPVQAMHRVDFTGTRKYEKVYDLDDAWFADPRDLADNVVEAFADGTFRAVRLNYKLAPWNNTMAFTPDTALNAAATDVHYDHWLALAARALLWAAGRQPPAQIAAVTLGADAWTVGVTDLAGRGQLWYRARDAWNRVYAEDTVPVRGPRSLTLPGLPLPPRTVVEFILRNEHDEVLDWYGAATPAATDTRIVGLTLDREAYGRGDTVSGSATLTSAVAGDFALQVFLCDHAGRRLARQDLVPRLDPAHPGTVAFALPIPDSAASLLMRLDARLYRDDRIVDTRGADVSIPETTFDGFYAGMYGGSTNRFADRQRRVWFRDAFGLDFMMRSGNHTYANLPQQNLLSVEYTTHLGYPQNEETFNKWMEPWEDFFPKNLWCAPVQVRRFRPIFYSLGEEHYMLMAGSANPAANDRFRKYLQGRYADLAALNATWGAAFTTWDEVDLMSPQVVDMLKLAFDVPRFENRRFMEHLFADKHAVLADWWRRFDPEASVGIHAGWDLWMGRGYDYWLLSRGLDAMMGYAGPQNQYIRSFFRLPLGSWYHYSLGSPGDVCWYPWQMLMSGMHGFGWYSLMPEAWGATTADMQLSSDFAASKDEFRDAGDLGDLLVRSRYLDDQVAVHYSQDSFQAGVPNLSWIHWAFTNLLFDGGVPFKFVSYAQVAEGELAARRFPVFLLPHSISLAPAEAEAIRTYVKAGGVLWADVPPGTHSQFGKPLDVPQLADLFADLKEETLPGGAVLKSGSCGAGTVVLADIGNYNYDRNVGRHLRAQTVLDRVAEFATLRRAALVTDRRTGERANGVWTAGYATAAQHLVVVCRDWQLADSSPAPVRLEFPVAGHVYEMRSGTYLGEGATVQAELSRARAKAFAVLPYKHPRLRADITDRPERGRDLRLDLSLDARPEPPRGSLHVVRVSVYNPADAEVTALRRLAMVHDGSGTVALPLAYDDPPGKWTVRLTDTATRAVATVTFRLEPTGRE